MAYNPLTTLPPGEENRPWYMRWTLVFGALTGLLEAAELTGAVAPGTTEASAVAVTQIGSAFGMLVGLYRQIANKRK